MKLKAMIQAAGLALTLAGAAQAQISDGVVKIGVLTDMSGTYSDISGQGAVVATQMAIDDSWPRRSRLSRSKWSMPITRIRATSPPTRRASGSSATVSTW